MATRSSLYPDQRVTAVTRIQFLSSPDGGSAPRKDLYSPERQRRPEQLEPQRQIPCKDLGPYLAPSAIDFVHRRMCHSYFAPAQSALFPPQKHVAKLVNELALPGRFSAKKEACSGANNPWCYFAVPLNNCATDQKKPSLKSVARCALFIMLF